MSELWGWDGASLGSTAIAVATGGVFGLFSGGASGESTGKALNDGTEPTIPNSVNAQSGIIESATGLFGVAIDGTSAPVERRRENNDDGKDR